LQQKGRNKAVKSLTWDQVNAWRLAQHGLAPRVGFMEAVRRIIGVQAQVMSAAELSLWARVDGLRPAKVQDALWQERALVKTWAMRGTLFLFAAEDLPLVAAARNAREARYWVSYFESYSIFDAEYQALLAAVPRVLGGEPMTREQLAVAVREHTGIDQLQPLLTESSWGTAFKPSAFRGDLCFGPTQGRNVAFVRPSAWLGGWREIDPKLALREVIRRYLSVYGPATPQDFSRWWGSATLLARKAFKEMGDELEAVDIEGRKAFALCSSLESMASLSATGIVRLLPMFDAYTHGLLDCDPLLPSAFKRLVFRPQAWISAVVLVDGRICGVWEHKAKRSSTLVTVRMFETPTAKVRKAIVAEAERLNDFLDTSVAVEFTAD
jgi:Winged helix DNA-binding domain